MQAITPLTDIDYDQMRRLVAQESVSSVGEIATMQLIEELFKERRDKLRTEARRNLEIMGGMTEGEIEKAMPYQLQPVSIDHIPVDDLGRYNLVIGKGDRENAKYTIAVVAHGDSFDVTSEDLLVLRDDETHPDRKRGRKAWDMGAAILNGIAGAAEFVVPKGMQVYWIFTVDEERNSEGAVALIKSWDAWKNVDLVLSSEIGELTDRPAEGDLAMRYIMARRGRMKMLASINSANEGHGANPHIPSATHAAFNAMYAMEHTFYGDKPGFDTSLQRKHPLLKEEHIEIRDIQSDRPKGDASNKKVDFKVSVRVVPPHTLQEVLEEQKQVCRTIAEQGNWSQWNLNFNLVPAIQKTCYPPYEMPENNEAVRIAKEVMRNVSGAEPIAAGAWSAADECLYYASMMKSLMNHTFEGTNKGVINIPIIGNHSHSPEEWVSWKDTARVRAVMRALIENEKGYAQFVQ